MVPFLFSLISLLFSFSLFSLHPNMFSYLSSILRQNVSNNLDLARGQSRQPPPPYMMVGVFPRVGQHERKADLGLRDRNLKFVFEFG
ncbi:hypothetical protein ACP275_02G119800 [Erythranthe tilingii]